MLKLGLCPEKSHNFLSIIKTPKLLAFKRLGAFSIITQSERLQHRFFLKTPLQIKFYTLCQGQTRVVINRIDLATHLNFPGIGTRLTKLPRVSAQVSIKVKDSKIPATGPLLIALGCEWSRHFETFGLGCPDFTKQKLPIYHFCQLAQ